MDQESIVVAVVVIICVAIGVLGALVLAARDEKRDDQ